MALVINKKKNSHLNNFVLIKKYSNRRLYNSLTSKYITQKELKKLICQGSDIKIVDYSSGKDLTQITLMQLLNEINEKEIQLFSINFLKKVIKLSSKNSTKKLSDFMELSIEQFEKNKDIKIKKNFSSKSLSKLELDILEIKKLIKLIE